MKMDVLLHVRINIHACMCVHRVESDWKIGSTCSCEVQGIKEMCTRVFHKSNTILYSVTMCVYITEPTTQTTPESTIITTTTGMTQHPITTTIPSLLQGTCASAGHINGCCTSGECFVQSGNCFCNVNCHDNHNCCPDIDEIGCVRKLLWYILYL